MLKLLVYVFLFADASPGLIFRAADALAVSFSGADVCHAGSVANPAGLSRNEQTDIQLSYGNRFMVEGPCLSSLSGTAYTQGGSFHSSLDYFGNASLHLSSLSLSYGRNLFRWLDAGMTLRYYCFSGEALARTDRSLSGDIGLLLSLSDHCRLGFHYIIPSGQSHAWVNESPFGTAVAGIAYQKKDNYYLCLQLSLNENQEPDLSGGAEYHLVSQLALRTGFHIGYCLEYSFGLGFYFSHWEVSVGFQNHTVLGVSSAISVTYILKEHE